MNSKVRRDKQVTVCAFDVCSEPDEDGSSRTVLKGSEQKSVNTARNETLPSAQ